MPFKKLSTILMVLVLGIILMACNSSTSNDGDSGSDSERATISVSIYDRGNVPKDEGSIEENRWTEWLSTNGPVDVNFVAIPRSEPDTKFNTLFAAGTAPDLVMDFNTGYLNTLYNQNLLLTLDDLIEEHSTEYKQKLEEYPILRTLGSSEDGELYKLGRINRMQINEGLFIRKDWLDKLNLEVPTTTDELFEVAKAFSEQDPDGNGEDDTFGINLSGMTGTVINKMFQNVDWVVEDDQLIKDWERVKEATEFKKRIFEAGIASRDFLNDTSEKINQEIVTGKIGIFGFNSVIEGKLTFDVFKNMKNNNPEAEVIPILLPESPFGQFNPMVDNPVHINAVINAHAENPEAVIKYVDFLAKDTTMQALTYGVDGEHTEAVDGSCPEIIDQDKFDTEVAWNGDFRMLSSYDSDECGFYSKQLNLDDPLQKRFYDIIDEANGLYLDPARPFAELTHQEHFPTPPQDLQLILTNAEDPILDLWNKAIVSGDSYTPDMAEEEAKSLWESTGGQKVEEWYKEWYEKNKNSWFFANDMYEFAVE